MQKLFILLVAIGLSLSLFSEKVYDRTPPLITADTLIVNQNDSFDPMQGVSAIDGKDGVVPVTLVSTTLPSSNADGTYFAIYQASDQKGNQSTYTRTIIIDKSKPIIVIDDNLPSSFEVGQDMPNLLDYFSITDTMDGDITVKEEMVSHSLNMGVSGLYPVTIEVSDLAGNVASKTLYIEVMDVTAPIVYLPFQSITLEINSSPLSQADWKDYIVLVTDDTDTLSIDDVQVSFAIDYNQVGTYQVFYSITDSSQNTSVTTLNVTVKDSVAPELSLFTATVQIEKGTVLSDALFEEYILYARDNNDGNLLDQVSISYHEVNVDEIGVYNVYYSIIDSSYNVTLRSLAIEIIDTTAPTILSNNESNEDGEYQVLVSERVTSYSIDNGQTWIDLDGPSTIIQLLFEELGTYRIKVQDAAGNISPLYVTYIYEDNTPPSFDPIPDQSISINTSDMDWTSIIENAYDSISENLTILEVEDNVLYDTLGTYTVRISVTDESGNSASQEFNVTVTP
jgi:hypothetical protein